MEQVLFQDFFHPPSRTSMRSANVFVKFVKSYLSKVVKRNTFSPNTNSASQCQQFKKILKAFPFLEYISSVWNIFHLFGIYIFILFGIYIFIFCNIFPLFGIYFIFLECISSFWNIFLFLKYISFFWNIFPLFGIYFLTKLC